MADHTKSALTYGVHHVGLTVVDVEQSKQFFIQTLGFEAVGELPAYPACFVSDGTTMITLWQAEDPATARPFHRGRNVGLHHLALAVKDSKSLDELHDLLKRANGVIVEFPPEPLLGGPARHMMCRIPGGIRVEFVERVTAKTAREQ